MKPNLPSVFICFFTGIFIISISVFAQNPAGSSVGKRANIWYFGHQAGLDFNSGAPVAITSNAMSTGMFCSSICDNNGNPLFYTDGDTVWNKNHQMMPDGLIEGSTGSIIILPKPGDPYLFYIFVR